MNLLPYEKEIIADYVKGKVLDLGAGDGRLYPLLRDKEYYGLELMEEHANKFKKDYPEANIIQGQAEKMSYPTKFFDIVLCAFNVIEELEDLPKALNEIKRVLKDDGLFIFSVHNKFHYKIMLRDYYCKRGDRIIKARGFLKREIIKMLKGFKFLKKFGTFTAYPYYIFQKEEVEKT